MYCRVCGAQNADNARFCRVCGAQLQAAEADLKASQEELDDDTPTEILTGQDPDASVFDDQKTVAFGSGSNTGQSGFLTSQTDYLSGQQGGFRGQPGGMPEQTGVLTGAPYRPPVYGQQKEKKKTSAWIYALAGIAALAVIAAVVVVILLNRKDEDSNATELAGSTAVTTEAVSRTETEEITTEKTTEKTTEATTEEKLAEAHVTYRTYVQSNGWLDWAKDGKEAGTQGESKRIEAFQVKLEDLKNADGGITYRAYVTDDGWQDWVSNTEQAGKKGEGKGVEAVEIKLTGEVADSFDVYYSVYVQGDGWLGWAKNGESAGTIHMDKRAESIKIELVSKKDGKAKVSDKAAYIEGKEEKKADDGTLSHEELIALYRSYRDALNAEPVKDYKGKCVAFMDITGDGVAELIYHAAVPGQDDKNKLSILSSADGGAKEVFAMQFDKQVFAEFCTFTRKGDSNLYLMWVEKEVESTSWTYAVFSPDGNGGFKTDTLGTCSAVGDGNGKTEFTYASSDGSAMKEEDFVRFENEFLSSVDMVVTMESEEDMLSSNGTNYFGGVNVAGGTYSDVTGYLTSIIGE